MQGREGHLITCILLVQELVLMCVLYLSKEKFIIVTQEVVDGNLAVNCGPDHRPSVCSFKVSPHDLIQLSITENHRLQGEALGPEKINSFLVFVRKSKI